jgi:two-component system sensor histidine kinase UhpB
VSELCDSFNSMLDRLEQERRTSGRRALLAQERERKRLARELHDEVGQTLTGVVLQLEGLHRSAPPELAEPVAQLQETAREGVEEVREIVRGLRPQTLDEFGLRSALISLAAGVTERAGVRVRARLEPELPPLAPEQDLAIYRVAQESLTNVARHANARNADLVLERDDGLVVLRVRDDGRGIRDTEAASEGPGLGGMRERALLIGGHLAVYRREGSGTEVRLEVPVP